MVKKWDHVYSLRTDAEHIRHLQEASVDGPGRELRASSYLIGSDEWWAAVDAGTIARRRFEGVVAEIYRSSTGELVEFSMTTNDGSELTCAFKGDPTRYVEGLAVRFDYLTVERLEGAETTVDVVTDLWIEHSHKRSQLRLHSFYPPPPSPI